MSFQVIGCVGDSIANGYWDERGLGWFGRMQEAIATKYPKRYGFNNMAMSGDRTRDTLHRLTSEAISRFPDIIIIATGGNDINRWFSPDGMQDQSPVCRQEAWGQLLRVAKTVIPSTE